MEKASKEREYIPDIHKVIKTCIDHVAQLHAQARRLEDSMSILSKLSSDCEELEATDPRKPMAPIEELEHDSRYLRTRLEALQLTLNQGLDLLLGKG